MKEFGKSFKDTLTFFALFKTAILCCLHFTGALKQDHLWLSIWLNLAFIWSNVLHTHRIYLVSPPPTIGLDFSQSFNNPGAALKVYPKNLTSTLKSLPYLVSTVWIPRDLLLIKRGRMSVQAFRSILSPLVWAVFVLSSSLQTPILAWCPIHRHQKALN